MQRVKMFTCVLDIVIPILICRSLELFPKVLSALAAQESVKYDGCEMSGTEYKGHVLNSLCAGRWDGAQQFAQ